ncbi:WYL domain-containing protein [Thalassotalea sp. PP2-459]|uniref:WYL domain-containing protein n=1 Tax=Thalassotalea sp. PP2-459 TaxID=1742724 RepID=UPI000943D467|nr:WYL domain-containing protein [Thalassotalea sp. PP2-459]OKY27128.1 hypothetical protein BI291_18020 [Thalassotalea sp. PP2-459]
MNAKLEEASPQVRERLAFIDFFAYFLGKVGRKELSERFGISAPVATRDFRLYNEIAPDNLVYRPSERAYFKSDNFSLMTKLSVDKCLSTLTDGFGDFECIEQQLKISESSRLGKPDLNTVAAITRAIHTKSAIEVTYFSTTSGESRRIIVPHTLVDTGMRWHARSYCRKDNAFKDFVVNRIISVDNYHAGLTKEKEQKINDDDWLKTIDLDLRPHPNLKNKTKAVELDYGMKDGKLIVNSRLATASYLLSGWNVDCTEDKAEKGKQFHLYLHNSNEIFDQYKSKLFIKN